MNKKKKINYEINKNILNKIIVVNIINYKII